MFIHDKKLPESHEIVRKVRPIRFTNGAIVND